MAPRTSTAPAQTRTDSPVLPPAYTVHAFARLRSTNDHAKVLLKRGALAPPAIVRTARQTAGRGRGTNTWWSGPGCLTATFAFRADPATPAERVPLYAGVALRRALAEFAGDAAVQLKWPNDLMFQGRKLAGILCERERHVDLVGIGINVAPKRVPAPLRPLLATLREIRGRAPEMDLVLAVVARRLLEWLIEGPGRPAFPLVRREYDLHHLLVGRQVIVSCMPDEPALAGQCRGLDESGRLVVQQHGRRCRILSGTVRLV